MKTRHLRSILLQAKYGSGIVLLAADVVLLLAIAADVWNVTRLHLSYVALVVRDNLVSRFATDSLVNFAILLVAPVLLALVVNFTIFRYGPGFVYRRTWTTKAKGLVLLFHALVVMMCIIHIDGLHVLEMAGGLCGSLDAPVNCFISPFVRFHQARWYGLVWIGVWFAGLIGKDTLYKGRELAKAFDLWRVLGPAGEYQPSYGDEIVYVNSASMAPGIKAIGLSTQQYHDLYQRAVPTSDRARRILVENANRARALLANYLFGDDEKRKRLFNIEFFPGTSRALEAGMLRIGNVKQVILSPYEHPSQVDVARWLCDTHGINSFTHVSVDFASFFERQWQEQVATVLQRIGDVMLPDGDGRVVLVLSEVHYLTGLRIDVAEIIKALRDVRNDLIVIIDASQAVGNLTNPLTSFIEELRPDDLYYFSAHKWLMSPNTCGVLVSQIRNVSQGVQPYDAFGLQLPTSTIDPNTIFGLVAALEFLFGEAALFPVLHEMSAMARSYFLTFAEDKNTHFEIIRSASTDRNVSLFLAVQPKFGSKWRLGKTRFWDSLRSRGVDLTVVPEAEPYFASGEGGDQAESRNYLLRISFPYFLSGRSVQRLVKHLNDLLEKAN